MDKTVLGAVIAMAETHLTNVQQEIAKLEANKVKIDDQVDTYKKYLTDSAEAIMIVKKEMENLPVNTPTPPETINDAFTQASIKNAFTQD